MATVTFLLVDQAGSTSQLAALGDEAGAPVRRSLFELLQSALADHDGREIDNTGDGLLACFDSAVSAIACGIDLQQRAWQHNVEAGDDEQLHLRVGVHTGEPVVGDDGRYFGMAIVIAARLCAIAQADQVLTTDLVKALVSARRIASFAEVGEQMLKGVEEPVSIWQVDWEPPAPPQSATPSLPARLVPSGQSRFAGRPTEVAQLVDLWKRAAVGERQLVFLAGEPGIGKTRLAAEVAKVANDAGATVLFGHCDEDLGIPYQPFVEAIRDLLRDLPTDLLAAHVAAHGGELGRLLPDLHRRVPDAPAPQPAEPETERFRLFEAMTGLLALAARANPVVLVLDDLHWASKPTILLLRRLAEVSNPLPLLVVGTYRSSDITADHPLSETLADLHREVDVTRLLLDGLSDDGVMQFMVALAGHDLDDDSVGFAHLLRRETQGNPFFVGELLRHLASTGAIVQRDGLWTTDVDLETVVLPDSVRGVVGRRVHRLSANGQRALTAAAVIGQEFDLATLSTVLDETEDQLLDALEDAVAAGLVAERVGDPGRFTFLHALIRHTLYEDLGATRRARMHRRIAEALELLHGADQDGRRLSELAHIGLPPPRPRTPTRPSRTRCAPVTKPCAVSPTKKPSGSSRTRCSSSTAAGTLTSAVAAHYSLSARRNAAPATTGTAPHSSPRPTTPALATTPRCSRSPRWPALR